MYSVRGIVQFIALVLILMQPIFSEIIRLHDGEITYEYDNSSKPLGVGGFARVFGGKRTEGNRTESVAFKESTDDSVEELIKDQNMYEMMGNHDFMPKFYRYFAATNATRAVVVMERLGRTLLNLWNEFRPFSTIIIMKIGLQILDALEWMHKNGFTHNDIHAENVAVGYHNKSKIYLLDFDYATKNTNETIVDLWHLSEMLNEMTSPSKYDKKHKRNKALKEFQLIAEEYNRIDDDGFRTEKFEKLRGILRTELESHKNDAEYDKLDIGYIQGSLTLPESFFESFVNHD